MHHIVAMGVLFKVLRRFGHVGVGELVQFAEFGVAQLRYQAYFELDPNLRQLCGKRHILNVIPMLPAMAVIPLDLRTQARHVAGKAIRRASDDKPAWTRKG